MTVAKVGNAMPCAESRFVMASANGLFDVAESVLGRAASSALRPVLGTGGGGTEAVVAIIFLGAMAAEAEIVRPCPLALAPGTATNAAVDFERIRGAALPPVAPGRGNVFSLTRLASGRPSAAAALSARALGPNCEMSSAAKPDLRGLGATIPFAASRASMLCVREAYTEPRGVWNEPRTTAAPPAADMDCQSLDTIDMRLSVSSFQAARFRAARRREKNT